MERKRREREMPYKIPINVHNFVANGEPIFFKKCGGNGYEQ